MKYRFAPLLATAVLVFSLVALIAAVVRDLHQSSDGAVHLTRADVHVGDAPGSDPPPVIDGAALRGSWTPVTLPFAAPKAGEGHDAPRASSAAAGGLRTTWIRIRLSLRGLHVAPEQLVLYGARIHSYGPVAVYVNGRLVHRAQEDGPTWNGLFTPLWVPLEGSVAATPPEEILVRLDHAPETSVAMSSLWLGPEQALRGRYVMRQFLQQELPAALNAAFLAVGVFALFVWFRRRQETGYLLFFNLAVISYAAHLHFYVNLPVTVDWFAWLTLNSLFWLIMIVHFFLCQVHGRPLTILTAAVVGITGLITVLSLPAVGVLPVLPTIPVIVPLIYGVALVMAAIVSIVGVMSAWRRSREARLVARGLAVCTLLGLSDWMMHNHVLSSEGWFLSAYTNAVTFVMFGSVIYRRYVSAIHAVEQANASLAERLRAREAELELSHRQLREVELRQTLSDERQRLMQDMHDGLGSTLISAIRQAEYGDMSDTKVAQLLKDCLDDLKLTIDSMEPVEADLLLLLATLRFRLEPRLEGTGIRLDWQVRELPTLTWLDPSSALHILRIVQESIANILRHTRATEIRVGTAQEGEGVQVSIEDNGQGFDIGKALATGTGRGLQNQQRRARALEGHVSWSSGNGGTRFVLWLPLKCSPFEVRRQGHFLSDSSLCGASIESLARIFPDRKSRHS